MSQKKNIQIKENYVFYKVLLSERKIICKEVIEIKKTGNNRNILESIEKVIHPKIFDDKMVLLVNVKVNNHNFFQFKLRYKTFKTSYRFINSEMERKR